MNYKVVSVIWADAHTSESGWLSLDDYEDDGECLVNTVGYLVPLGDAGSKDGHISIWQTLCDGEGIHGFHIPVGMVRKIQIVDLS